MNKKFAIVLALSLIAIVCCAGCIDPQDQVDPVDPVVPVDPVDPVTPPVEPVVPAVEYSVFFMLNYDGAGAYSAETVTAGDAVSKPATPTRSGYTFKGWFTAAEGGAEYDFTQAVNADLTLYAQWSKKSSSSGSGHSHSYSWNVVKEANCTVDGQGQYVCSCGQVKSTEVILATGHLETEEVVNAAVDTEIKCKACGLVLVTIPKDESLKINNLEELKAFADTVNSGTDYAEKTVELMVNIDLSTEDWVPIGQGDKKFKGTFNGNGKTIVGLNVVQTNSDNAAGFFGVLNGNVQNLNFKNADVTGTSNVGVVAGKIHNTGSISNVKVTNSEVSGNHWVGGIVGYMYGSVSSCTVKDITVTAIPHGDATNGYRDGDKAGGIVGFSAGDNTGTITSCSADNVTVTGFRDVGGIAGAANGAAVTSNSVSNINVIVDKATNTHNDGLDSYTGAAILGRLLADGGDLADQDATNWKVIIVYADGFQKVTDDTGSVYEISSASGLKAFRDSVNAGEPYSGKTVKLTADIDLKNNVWKPIGVYAYHKETVGGKTKDVVDTDHRFKGIFDGDKHTISNLNIVDSCDLRSEDDQTEIVSGFFSALGGTVQNVIFDGVSVKSENSNAVGVVVGKLMSGGGSITCVTVKNANIDGQYCVGAVAGSINGVVTYATVEKVTVSGNHYVGGVVGYVYGTVTESSVSESKITAVPNKVGEAYDNGDKAGGIVGYLAAEPTSTLEKCLVKDTIVTGYRDVGGIAGMVNTGDSDTAHASVKSNKANTVTITADQSGDTAYGYKTPNAGEIVGRIDSVDVDKIDLGGSIDSDCIVVVKLGASNSDNLKDSLADATPGSTVNVPDGTYTFPSSELKNAGDGVTLVCAEGTVFEGNSKANINGATVIGATFSNPSGNAVDQTINGVFKDCTFTGSNGLRKCYAGETVVFENCVFSGDVYGVHFDGGANDVLFKGCTFSGFNALGSALTQVTFEDCTFVGNGQSGYNGANLWGNTTMIRCEFTFDGTTATEWIDCIGADKMYVFKDCTINGVAYTYSNYHEFEEISSRNDVTVTIDGVDCAL